MKLTPVVADTLKKIAASNFVLLLIENLVFFLLGFWKTDVLYGSLLGYGVSVLNFYLMGISVQKAMDKEPKQAQAYMQSTYNGRFGIETIACVIAFIVPIFNGIAAVIPLIFTRISILIIQSREKSRKKSGKEE